MTSVVGIKSNQKGIINEIIEYLDCHYTNMNCRNGLAEKFGIHSSYLFCLFKEHVHISVIEYINHKRVELVKELLMDGDNKMIDIAYHAGFNNLSYFYRTFKKYTGLTPLEYGQRVQSMMQADSAG